MGAISSPTLNLVGHSNFTRTNPRSDLFPVLGFHHIEFWCADASTAAARFTFSLGMRPTSRSDLSTSNPHHASYLLTSSNLRFLFTAPYSPALSPPPSPPPTIPSFDPARARAFSAHHALAVRAIALRVADAAAAYHRSVAHGARPAHAPADLGGGFILAEVELYGDVVLRYISYPDDDVTVSFLPGFEDLLPQTEARSFGILRLDHAVGNVENLADAVAYVSKFTGFHPFAEFTAEDVGTAESGLNSVVLACNDETVLIPMNEPVHGTKRRSQIQTYLDHNGGAGVQHLALASGDVFRTLREMRSRSGEGGFEFMPPPPPTYYRNLGRRVGDVLTEEQIRECEELGLLVDRDDQGVLLQIFTKPVGDRNKRSEFADMIP